MHTVNVGIGKKSIQCVLHILFIFLYLVLCFMQMSLINTPTAFLVVRKQNRLSAHACVYIAIGKKKRSTMHLFVVHSVY